MKIGVMVVWGSILASGFGVSAVSAAEFVWNGAAGDGKWSTPGNWVGQSTPTSGSGNTMVISSAGLPTGADGIPEMDNDLNIQGFTVGLLQVPSGSGSFRLKGKKLTLSKYIDPNADSSKITLTVEKAAFSCLAENAKVEIATDIYITGCRGFLLGENTDVTFSGEFTDNNGNAYVYKLGPASSRFAMTGAVKWKGYSSSSATSPFTNVVFHARGGTNEIALAALGPTNSTFWLSGEANAAFKFVGGESGANVRLRELASNGKYYCSFDGDCTFGGDFTIVDQINGLELFSNARTIFDGSFVANHYIGYLYLCGSAADYAFRNGIRSYKTDYLVVRLDGGSATFDGPVTGVKSVIDSQGTYTGALNPATFVIKSRFDAPSSFYIRWFNVICGAADVFNPVTSLTWNYDAYNNRGIYDLNGHDQTVSSFSTTASDRADSRVIRSEEAATLTVSPAADVTVTQTTRMKGALTFRYAPTGNFTYVLTNFISTATGDLFVDAGTLRIAGVKATCASVSSVQVAAGATFEMNSAITGGGSLEGVQLLKVGSGATFSVGADATDPFKGRIPFLDVVSDSTVVLPADCTVGLLRVDGEYVAGGRYQANDGTDPVAMRLPWLTGGSVMTVDAGTYWKASVREGAWDVSANWNGGVPTVDVRAGAINEGSDYAIRVTSPAAVGGLDVRNDGTHTTTVAVSNSFSMTETATVLLENGGRMEIGTDGNLQFMSRAATASAGGVEIGKAGALLVSGSGTASLYAEKGQTKNPLYLSGGEVSVSGQGRLGICGDARLGRYFGSGKVSFEDDAALVVKSANGIPRVYVGPNAAGETFEMDFSGASSLKIDEGSQLDQFVLGYLMKGGTSVLNCSGTGEREFGYLLSIGADYGRAEVHVSGGVIRTRATGGYGIDVGGFAYGSSRDTDVEGLLDVSGGVVEVNATSAFGQKNRLRGLCVGTGWYHPASYGNHFVGEIDLSGGAITNNGGCVILGAGNAEGRMIQTGGEMVANSSDARAAMLVGFLGGIGEYVLSNGVATIGYDVYVGGAITNRVGFCPDAGTVVGHDAVGTLSVVGGSFKTSGSIVLSADGTGFLEVGPNAQIEAANVVLSNGTCSAKTSTLKFVCGESGAGKIKVSDHVDVAPGSKLKVDMSGYKGERRGFTLMSFNSSSGKFADEDVEVVGWDDTQNPVSIIQSSRAIRVSWRPGLAIILR